MVELNLQPDEGIVLQTENADFYDSEREGIDQLYLTNKRLIFIVQKSKGLFKYETEMRHIPLSSIKIIDGKVQIMNVKGRDTGRYLQILLDDGSILRITFDHGRKIIPQWVSEINKNILGDVVSAEDNEKLSENDIDIWVEHSVQNGVASLVSMKEKLRASVELGKKRGIKAAASSILKENQWSEKSKIEEDETKQTEPEQMRRQDTSQSHKCPACGEDIPSYTAFCPACGHELSSAQVSSSLQNFIDQIEVLDRKIANNPIAPRRGWKSWGILKKIGWVFLNIIFGCFPLLIYAVVQLWQINKAPSLTVDEKQKASLIENYEFPNNRGDILDALLYIKNKVSLLASWEINANNAYWARIWINKAEGLYQRAEMMFPGDKIANEAFRELSEDRKKINLYMKIRLVFVVALIVIATVFLVCRGSSSSKSAETESYNATLRWHDNGYTALMPEAVFEKGKVTYICTNNDEGKPTIDEAKSVDSLEGGREEWDYLSLTEG
jgi:hypothetical protein